MVRKYKTYTGLKSTRKVAAARAAVNRASQVLRARGAGPMAPLSTRGFYGLWNGRGKSELKVIDIGYTIHNVPGTGDVTLLNGVAAGTDFTNRIGRKIMIRSLLFQCNATNNSANNAPYGETIRVALVYDSQPNGALPTFLSIFNEATVVSPMNLDNRDRYQIIKDWRITLNGQSYTAGLITGGTPAPKFVKCYKKLYKPTIFNGVANTIGAISSGAIYLCTCTNQTTNQYAIQFNSRIRFEDA